MVVNVLPQTPLGKTGFCLSVAFLVLFVLKVFVTFPLPSLIIFGIGLAGVVVNVIAIFRKERALLFFIVGGLISAFVIFWVSAELLFPH